jgi:hypothetical protein
LVLVAEAFRDDLALRFSALGQRVDAPQVPRVAALLEPRLIKNDLLVGKYKIALGEQDDGVFARLRRVGRSGVKVLIAFNAPGVALFLAQTPSRPVRFGSEVVPTV